MARKIIIQERVNEPSDFSFAYVLWVDVPSARQPFYADAAKLSAVKDITTAELSALRNGAVLERREVASFPDGTTAATIKADLIARWTAYQAQVLSVNPWRFYGTWWDGTTWTTAGAA